MFTNLNKAIRLRKRVKFVLSGRILWSTAILKKNLFTFANASEVATVRLFWNFMYVNLSIYLVNLDIIILYEIYGDTADTFSCIINRKC